MTPTSPHIFLVAANYRCFQAPSENSSFTYLNPALSLLQKQQVLDYRLQFSCAC